MVQPVGDVKDARFRRAPRPVGGATFGSDEFCKTASIADCGSESFWQAYSDEDESKDNGDNITAAPE